MGLSLSSSSKISPRFSHFPFYSPFSSFLFALSFSPLMRGGTSSGYCRRTSGQDDGMRSGIVFLCDVWGQGSRAQAVWDVHHAAREGEATELNPFRSYISFCCSVFVICFWCLDVGLCSCFWDYMEKSENFGFQMILGLWMPAVWEKKRDL